MPALYPTSQIGLRFAADQEARRWSGRLTQNLVVMNGAAAAAVVGFWWAGRALPFDGFAIWYFALFVLGLSCALLAMLNHVSRAYDLLLIEQSRWLIGLRAVLSRVDSFWLLFLGLFSFVLGAACALIALSTAPAAGTPLPGPAPALSAAPAAGPPPALTRAAVGYWESELASAMLAGDRGLFLASCASLSELQRRPGICDLSAALR